MLRLRAAARVLTLAPLLLPHCLPPPARAQAACKEATLRLLREQFGAPSDSEKNLFGVNENYVLEAKFDGEGRLSELSVVPKYFFEESHPEWKDPGVMVYLTEAEYEALLARLDSIKPRGKLLKAGTPRLVTNLTSPVTDTYEHAELRRGELIDLRRGEHAPRAFRHFSLRYHDTLKVNSREARKTINARGVKQDGQRGGRRARLRGARRRR